MANIPEILKSARTIAVVGLSSNPMRPTNGVSEYMKRAGYRIIPVNPNETEVLGEKCYARWKTFPSTSTSSTFSAGRNSFPDMVESAIRVGARTVWMQEGVIHEAAAERARQAGLDVVMDRCTLKEHRKLDRLGDRGHAAVGRPMLAAAAFLRGATAAGCSQYWRRACN